jgi:hypothetical protein
MRFRKISSAFQFHLKSDNNSTIADTLREVLYVLLSLLGVGSRSPGRIVDAK